MLRLIIRESMPSLLSIASAGWVLAAFAAAWAPSTLNAQQIYAVAPREGARFALTVEKTGLMRGKKHLFLFDRYEGKVSFDAANPAASTVQLRIDSRSLVCKDDWVSAKDLANIQKTALEDMLDAAHHPSMTFASTSIRALGESSYEVQGNLTIRGRSKPVTVSVRVEGRDRPEWTVNGSAAIRITDYGLKPPSAVLGAIGTKDEMTLAFTLLARRGSE